MLIHRNSAMWLVVAFVVAIAAANSSFAEEGAVQRFRVLSFNILMDAKSGGVKQTAEVINASQADIVGIQEIFEIGPELDKLTGLKFIKQPKGGILTRFPVVEHSIAQFGVKLAVRPGVYVWHYNVHLNHAPYQPYQLAGIPYGKENPFIETSAEAIAEALRARGLELARLLMDMAPAIRSKERIIVTGDFNEPSHLDWTAEAVQAKLIPLAVSWPQSRALVDSGFQDAFRDVHPDPVQKPGDTWTPRPAQKDVLDRIDFVYHRGLKPVQALVVGEAKETSDVVVSPYPSDHRAVLIEFQY